MIFLLIFFPLLTMANTGEVRLLIDKALERTPILKIHAEELNAQTLSVRQSRLLANPTLTYQGGQVRSDGSSGVVTDLTLNQPFPWPGRRSSRIKSEEFLVKLRELDLSQSRISLSHRVYLLCAEIAALQEMEMHHQERRKRFGLIHQFLRSRIHASPKMVIERGLIEVQIKLIEKNMYGLSMQKQALVHELEMLTGEKAPRIGFNWDKLPSVPDKDRARVQIAEGPLLRRQGVKKELFENRVTEARYEARPDIVFGVNYRRESVEPANHFYHAQVSLVIPILDRGQHSEQIARARLRQTEAENKVGLLEIEKDLDQAYSIMLTARKSADLFPVKEIAASEKSFIDAETAFRKGQIDAMTFLQSDSHIHETIDQVYLSRLTYLTQLSRVGELAGLNPEF